MNARTTAVLLGLATLLVVGTGVAAATSAQPTGQVENTTVDHTDDTVTLTTGPNATVTGETGLEPGTTLTLRLRSAGGNAFLLTDETTVRDDGQFVADFDATGVPNGENATLVVRSDGVELTETSVRLVAAETTTSPTAVPETGTGTSSGDGAGFGPLVAVVAVLASALVLARER